MMLAGTVRLITGLASTLLLVAGQAAPVNFSGKWIVPQEIVPGYQVVGTLTINQVGDTAEGSLHFPGSEASAAPVNDEIFDGKVDGSSISFYVWRGEDKPAKQFYKGTLRGDEIVFTVTGGPPPPVFLAPTKLKPENQVIAKRER